MNEGHQAVEEGAGEPDFRILVDTITDYAIYRLSTDGMVVSWNAGAQQLKGYTAEEAIGLPLSQFYSEEERTAEAPETALRVARTKGKFTGAGWRHRKDGSRFWAQVTIEPIYGKDSELLGYAKITRDLTRQQDDQDRLAALARNLDVALSSMHQGICLYGADERLVLSNGRVEEMFGVAPGECPSGTPFIDVVRLVVIETLEALLIESLEPPLNRRRGDNFSGVEYLQMVDPEIERIQQKRVIDQLSRSIAGGDAEIA